MAVYYVGYDLQDGYIHHWLVAGPQALPVPDPDRLRGRDLRLQIARHYYEEDSGVAWPPVERGALGPGDAALSWYYIRCLDDHFVDLSDRHPACCYLRAWAYARIASPASQEVTFVLTTYGPADLWLNGRHLQRQEPLACQSPHSLSFPAALQEGHNEILVRFEQVALRECPYRMALRIVGFPSSRGSEPLRVLLPIPDQAGARRQTLERVFEAAYLDRDVYAGNEHILVRWPEDLAISAEVMVRLQRPSGRIYSEAHVTGKAGDHAFLGRPWEVPEGPYQAVLMPRPREYYDLNMRIQRTIDLWVLNRHFFRHPHGTYEERRLEALHDAAQREGGLFAEIAKMELGHWPKVKAGAIEEAIQRVQRREEDSNVYLLGLLGMMYRYGKNPAFPSQLQRPLEKCVLEFRYGADEPGDTALCPQSESRQIVLYACEILAGQLYPRRRFADTGKSGKWHRERGEQRAMSWLHRRGIGGFREWDSHSGFERIVLALSHLVDLARSRPVWEWAAVVMDKLFFTMALNSYRGVFGSTHGQTHTLMIKNGRLESTAGISRLMWGMGAFNHHIMGTVSLACAKEYELPSVISDVAVDLPEEMWNRERHAGERPPAGRAPRRSGCC